MLWLLVGGLKYVWSSNQEMERWSKLISTCIFRGLGLPARVGWVGAHADFFGGKETLEFDETRMIWSYLFFFKVRFLSLNMLKQRICHIRWWPKLRKIPSGFGGHFSSASHGAWGLGAWGPGDWGRGRSGCKLLRRALRRRQMLIEIKKG